MKKLLALISALMILLLAACGQEAAEKVEANTEKVELNEDGLYVDEYQVSGMQVKAYHQGGKDGVLVRRESSYSSGDSNTEYFDAEGKLSCMISQDASGAIRENYYSSNGSIIKNIVKNPDGSYSEFHYAEGNAPGAVGIPTYSKEVAADGTVLSEFSMDVRTEDDGSYWETHESEDGTVHESLIGKDGMVKASKSTNLAQGYTTELEYSETGAVTKFTSVDSIHGITTEAEYYPSGNIRVSTDSYENSEEYYHNEYYENGNNKYSYSVSPNGIIQESKHNEDGYYTYLYRKTENFEEEFFADEYGKLIKYIDDGKVYEEDDIPSWIVSDFELMQENTQQQ